MFYRWPKIKFKYVPALDRVFINYCKHHPRWKNWSPPSEEQIVEKSRAYLKEWKKYDKKIIRNMAMILGVNFKRNIIDVYIVSGNPRKYSDPIILDVMLDPENFVDVLTHELIHVLLRDSRRKIGDDLTIWQKKFPEESNVTKRHIIVNAVLKYIYMDVLKQASRLERDIGRSRKHPNDDYLRAWEIVNEVGYLNIIKEFRNNYKKSPLSWWH